jgi:glycosyltransferase involved in cell wall biosynthesis
MQDARSSRYLMVLNVKFYRMSPTTFAVESAFCDHLRMLKARLGAEAETFCVAGPPMSEAEYERGKSHLGTIDEARESILFCALHNAETGRIAFWMRFLPLAAKMYAQVRDADIVHSSYSHDLFRPVQFVAVLMALWLKKKTVVVIDIDNRNSAWMNYRTGHWTLKSYLLAKYLYDPLRTIQIRIIARFCSLVLLKGRKMVCDFGAGRSSVKYILDAAFSREHIIPAEVLESKIKVVTDASEPLHLVYFGRIVQYKGLICTVQALDRVNRDGSSNWQFHVIGAGDEEAALRSRVQELGLSSQVIFHAPIPFGKALFDVVRTMDILLATPLSEDTPRSALDAMACGVPVLAFDTYYYKDLAEISGAVETVPWPDVDALACRISHLVKDRAPLSRMIGAAVKFSRENTQEIWLDRRVRWTLDLSDSCQRVDVES